MIATRLYSPADLMLLSLQPRQRQLSPVSEDYATKLADAGPAHTVLAEDGTVLACMGLINQWEGCARAYAFFCGDVGYTRMREIISQVSSYLEDIPVRRVEAAVQMDFRSGHKLVRRLGFNFEGIMEKYWNDQAAVLYARIR
jgi:hypothetical protein